MTATLDRPQANTDPRWARVVARDSAADGQFVYAVSTTGIYCRPSCGARRPRAEHVRFYLSTTAAEDAGYRPCRRCTPDQPPLAERHSQLVAALCRQIETAETPPSLQALAHSAQLSAYHLHRVFKAVTGVTPKAYADNQRAQKVRAQLATRSSVTEALYDAGFNASSRFYESAEQVLGMPPKNYRSAGADTQIRFAVGQCSLGAILVAASPRGVCAILLGDEPEPLVREIQERFHRAELIGDDPAFAQTVVQVIGFVEAPRLGLGLPLDIRGTAFQQRVWQALQHTAPGTTLSYSGLAQQIGAPSSTRAVAQACAANLLAVAIPCHRVVRRDGALSGYRWGVERKLQLLQRETPEQP